MALECYSRYFRGGLVGNVVSTVIILFRYPKIKLLPKDLSCEDATREARVSAGSVTIGVPVQSMSRPEDEVKVRHLRKGTKG